MTNIFLTIIIGVICAFLGGVLVYKYQSYWEKSKTKNFIENQIDQSRMIIPPNFINSIDIGMNMRKIEALLGLPDYSYHIDESERSESNLSTYIDSYKFENCSIIITHNENQLTSYIINAYEKSIIHFITPNSDYEKPILNKFAVDDTFDKIEKIIFDINYRESWFGIVTYNGRAGGYYNYCYFGDLKFDTSLDSELKIDDLKSNLIKGFGVSSDPELFNYYSSL